MNATVPTHLQHVLERCGVPCAGTISAELLNRHCFCVAVDPIAVRGHIDELLQAQGTDQTLAEAHANLFSALPVFVPMAMLQRMAAVVRALSKAAASAPYLCTVLEHAPVIAQHDPHSPGGVLGFDFHLAADGPRLI